MLEPNMRPLVSRRVVVDRSLRPEEVIRMTGRNLLVNQTVNVEMPRGEGDSVEVFFFLIDRDLSDAELDLEYSRRGLVPCDPYSLAKVNQDDPTFARSYPHVTYWVNRNGRRCVNQYYCSPNPRMDPQVSMSAIGGKDPWSKGWWFAGLRK